MLPRPLHAAPLGVLPLALLGGQSLPQLPVGRAPARDGAARGGLSAMAMASPVASPVAGGGSRALVALVAALPAHVSIRRRQAGQRRPELARADRARRALRDPAPPSRHGLVRPSIAHVAALP